MRIAQVPQALHWDTEPGKVEILLRQESGNHLPWVEVALVLFVLIVLGDNALALDLMRLLSAAIVLALVIAVGWFYETTHSRDMPALVRLDWEAQEALVTATSGRTTRAPLKAPGYAHPVRLRGTIRTGFATGWEKPDGSYILVRHKNRSESTNFLRDLARAGWPVHREELVLS